MLVKNTDTRLEMQGMVKIYGEPGIVVHTYL